MSRALVAYYSWTGRTRQIAEVIAAILEQRAKFRRVALFCTEGGANGEKALAQVASLCGKIPAATLVVTERDFASGADRPKVLSFTKALK